MSRQRVGAIVFFVAIMCPRPSSADILDVLWKMSGTQQVSLFPLEVRIPLQGEQKRKDTSVVIYDYAAFKLEDPPADPKVAADRKLLAERLAERLWLAINVTAYTSTGTNSSGNDYRFGRTHLLAIEPLVEHAFPRNRHLYYGLGASYQRVFGPDIQAFDKFAFKIRPIGVQAGKFFDLALNVRVYPNGYTSDEFGFGTRQQDMNRPAEVVWGFSYGFSWVTRNAAPAAR
jgi:hypothetical protein